MAQYQARGWLAWHHHMALVALAVLFQMQERMSEAPTAIPNLTAADIVELMEWALMKRPSEAELIARIERRHEKRERSARNKREAQKKKRKRAAKSSLET